MMDADARSDGTMWDRRFGEAIYAYGKEPNAWLKQQIEPPIDYGNNLALFPADGEGRNAVWAASLGWNAEVFDLSSEGNKKCQQLAKERGVIVKYEIADLVEKAFDEPKYNLLACSWFHTPSAIRKKHLPRMLHCLTPGGSFIMEGYHTSQMPLTSGGPKSLELLFDLDELLEELCGPLAPNMKVVHASVDSTNLDESELHRGHARVVRLHLIRDV